VNARDEILAAVRRNLPPAVPLPVISGTDRSRMTAPGFEFQKQLEAMGGRLLEVADGAAASGKVAELFPIAKVICSAVPEVSGWRPVSGWRRAEDVRDPHELNDVDVGVVRSPLGVAEAGAVWLTQAELIVNALGVLSQHLVVLLDRAAIVQTMDDAYARIDLAANHYGVFMAGPSATADIEGVIIHGAQGARSLTVLLFG
jgi:L-lactate dehydrogenase complex protein LldG